MFGQYSVSVIKLSDVYNRSECSVQYRHRSSCDRNRMMSIEQLSLMVNRHLGLDTYNDELQKSKKWTIFESPLGGRGLVATEDIKTGEVLFVDHPLIYGPRFGTIVQRGCTTCRKIDSDTFFKCSKCALLLCSEQCQNSDVHYSDCNTISCWPNKVPIEDVDDTVLSRALTPIRALLLYEEQRNLLTSLQAHDQPQHGSEIRRLKEYFDIPLQVEQYMTFVTCVLDANAFQVATPYGKKEMNLRGLYPVSSLMNHNCVPNTRHSFNSDTQMTVKAVKPIRAGTEIFACYSGILWGTPARRLHLYKTKHFFCKCDRCADPTERGTLLAALKCFSTECPGSMLPLQPLKTNTAWRCLDCGLRVPSSNICAVQGALGSLVGSLNFENVLALENYFLYRITKYIPKTNQIVVDLQCRLIWELGEAEGFRWNGQMQISTSERQVVRQFQIPSDVTAACTGRSEMAQKATIGDFQIYLSSSAETLPVTIGQSGCGGRGLYATKYIKKGSQIFMNTPMAIGPRADSVSEKFCANCYLICDLCYPCEKCYVFVCSDSCKNSISHTKLCVFIHDSWKLKTKPDNVEDISKALNQVLLYLRFLLLPEEQRLLLNIFQRSDAECSFNDLEIILAKYLIPEQHIKFIKIVNAVIRINSFRISDCPIEKKIHLRGMYPLSAFMNHNCVPNTRNVFSKDYTMAVYATKDIEIGEEISSCYTVLLWCSPARRCHLYKSKQFWCNCKRCTDVTEMGTMLSALKCVKKDCIGDILPMKPLDPRTNWLCDSCKIMISPDIINNIQSILGSLLGTFDLDRLRMENAVLKRLAILIPYSNHIFVDIQLRLAIKLGFEGDYILNGIRCSLMNNALMGFKINSINKVNVAKL